MYRGVKKRKKLAQASIDGASTEITLNLTRSLRVKKQKKRALKNGKKKRNEKFRNSSINKYFSRSINFYTFENPNSKNIGKMKSVEKYNQDLEIDIIINREKKKSNLNSNIQ